MGYIGGAGLTLDALETRAANPGSLVHSSHRVAEPGESAAAAGRTGEIANHPQKWTGCSERIRIGPGNQPVLPQFGQYRTHLAARSQALNLLEEAQSHRKTALNYYQSALAIAPSRLTKSQAQLNQLSLLLDDQQLDRAVAVRQNYQSLGQIPPSRAAVYAQVNFANSLIGLADQTNPAEALPIGVPQLLEQTLNRPNPLRMNEPSPMPREPWAPGTSTSAIGRQLKPGLQKPLQKAQSIRAPDVAYQWQWQMGRLLQAEFETQTGQFPQSDSSSLPPAAPAAIRYYSTTVETLNSLRSDLVALNPDVQFSFRESVEPVYRQLVDLLLRDEQPASEQLLQARNVIESLQLAELDNFFRDACAQPEPTNVATLDANAAVVYPILLKNRLELIVQLPRAASAPSAKAVGDGPSRTVPCP
jgi:hypothetical protein